MQYILCLFVMVIFPYPIKPIKTVPQSGDSRAHPVPPPQLHPLIISPSTYQSRPLTLEDDPNESLRDCLLLPLEPLQSLCIHLPEDTLPLCHDRRVPNRTAQRTKIPCDGTSHHRLLDELAMVVVAVGRAERAGLDDIETIGAVFLPP